MLFLFATFQLMLFLFATFQFILFLFATFQLMLFLFATFQLILFLFATFQFILFLFATFAVDTLPIRNFSVDALPIRSFSVDTLPIRKCWFPSNTRIINTTVYCSATSSVIVHSSLHKRQFTEGIARFAHLYGQLFGHVALLDFAVLRKKKILLSTKMIASIGIVLQWTRYRRLLSFLRALS
jgi:hypothetical protein